MINEFIFLLIASIENDEDSEFITEIFEKYSPLMIKKANEYLRNRTDAEDVVQNAFEKLIKKIPVLKTLDCCSLIVYLVSTIRNTSINFIKSHDGTPKSVPFYGDDGEINDFEANVETPEKIFFDKNNREQIHKAVKQLPEKYKIVLECKYLQDMSDADIAAILNIKPDSVREYLTRARKMLSQILAEEADLYGIK